ncbi:MAG: putative HD phosphohydrolase [Granulosicoccus sp.]|jgi:predicted HD phosphohydrolase
MNALTNLEIVSFNRMDEGTVQDYALLDKFERQHIKGLPDRLLEALVELKNSLAGYKISRLEHSLQSASRAEDDNADVELIVAALIHDLGDELAPENHSQLAASIIRPYVRAEVTWAVHMHGLFQMQFYGAQLGLPTDGHLKYKNHPWFTTCQRFCDDWDQQAFDPDYPTRPLSHFEPMLREIFSRPAFAVDIVGAEDPLS